MSLPEPDVLRWFRAALELESSEIPNFLTQIADPAQREQVKSLLQQADALAHAPPLAAPTWPIELVKEEYAHAGDHLGRYRLVRQIGVGGMGQVWLAERTDGIPMRVAIKWVHRALNRQTRARFERERSLLSTLDHPGIARILDGGEDDGIPWFAMEYVAAQSLSQYVQTQAIELRAKLQLVQQICEAVAYAQQRLIVHRDLKPGNILVKADGTVKVIDFGIAKLLGDTDEALTQSAAPLTLAYAAPEQIRGEPITTATDVYALGVILFELLTGERPHVLSAEDDRGLSLLQAISERDVSAPSAFVARGSAAQQALAPQLVGDLDTIVLKALDRDPRRRYGSAQALLDDLANYLAQRPINARADSPLYRLQKFFARHRVSSVIAVLASVGILAAVGSAWWSARQETIALQHLAAMSQANAAAREFLVDLFRAAAPEQHLGKPLTALQMLERGWHQLQSTNLKLDPLARAQSAAAIGDSFYSLGAMASAQAAYAMALKHFPADGDRAVRGKLALDMAATDAELLAFDSARTRLTAWLSGAHANELDLKRRALRLLGFVERDAMHYGASVNALKQAQQLRPKSDTEQAAIENSLAFSLALAGDLIGAKAMFEQTRQRLASLPKTHPSRIWLDYTEGDAMRRLGDLDLASSRLDAALAQLSQMQGQGDEIRRMVQLARVVLTLQRGETPSATEWQESGLREQAKRGLNLTELEAHFQYLRYLNTSGEQAAAKPLAQELTTDCTRSFGAKHPMCKQLAEFADSRRPNSD